MPPNLQRRAVHVRSAGPSPAPLTRLLSVPGRAAHGAGAAPARRPTKPYSDPCARRARQDALLPPGALGVPPVVVDGAALARMPSDPRRSPGGSAGNSARLHPNGSSSPQGGGSAPGSGPDFMMRSVMSLPDTLRMRSQARGPPPGKLPACACCGAGRAGRAPEVSHPALCARASTAAALPHPNPAARRARQELLAELEIGQPLGRGSYGRVYRGARRPNAPPAAPPLRPVRAAPVARPSRLRRLRAPLGRPGSWCCAAAVQGAGWCMHVPSSSIWEGADGGPDGGPAGEDWGQP